MAQVLVCAWCNEILTGRSGTAYVNRPHFSVRQFSQHIYRKEVKSYINIHLGPINEVNHFCSLKCLSQMAQAKREEWEEKLVEQRKEQYQERIDRREFNSSHDRRPYITTYKPNGTASVTDDDEYADE